MRKHMGLALLVLGSVVGVASAQESATVSDIVLSAIDQHDFDRIRGLREGPATSQAERLADAVVHGMLGRDDLAEELLRAVLRADPAPAIRARALRALSGALVRQGRYGAAAEAMHAIRDLPDADGVTVDDMSIAFFAALAEVPAMERVVSWEHRVDARYDQAGLPRVEIAVNNVVDEAIFDTGAAFSTVTVSAANRMGLRPLGAEVDVGGSTSRVVESGLAVANQVTIGGALFRNVVFIVVPDESVSFPEQGYSISSILGLPLIREMGRVEWVRNEAGARVTFGRTAHHADARSANMITSGWQQVVLGSLDLAPGRARLFLDTGAQNSSLYALAGHIAPDLLGRASSASRSVGGLGGVVEQQEVQEIPSYTLSLGGTRLEGGRTPIVPDDGSFRHGTLGQDMLGRFERLILDFDAMAVSGVPASRAANGSL